MKGYSERGESGRVAGEQGEGDMTVRNGKYDGMLAVSVSCMAGS